MSVGGTFLGGASGRLLPAAIPLRYFGAAAAFHLLAWLALLVSADDLLAFRGGLGWPLAALHLLTLGVFGMTALGAGAQLLPVATRQQPVGANWLAWVWRAYAPGVAVLAAGMGLAQPAWIAVGAVPVVLALAAWGILAARHLWCARGMPGVVAHAWAALVSLFLLLATALLLVAGWLGWQAPSRAVLVPLHLVLAPYGFMGLLSAGLAYVLVPMFALGEPPREAAQLTSGALLALGILAAIGAILWPEAAGLGALAWAAGTTGVLLHLHLMRGVLASGLRRELGPSFTMVKSGWAALLATLVFGGVLWTGLPVPHAPGWFALALLAWLLGVVLGFMQRILPFLASLHAASGRRRGPTAAGLTDVKALKVHFRGHFAALALLAGALAFDSTWLVRAGALAGTVGAVGFALFYARLLARLRTTRP
ncbi:hypothetical protein [Ramlibacter albus]|uniref:Uncharacterized protein n=1 Tax=Ramlibacter albus TaxID=2079448 RepID=A0A923S8I9_9BURK|nr:hypothetical protein [Ramlibacter albus]MBC5768142.1 hypothetical protein [Ramlibacter albus]